MVDFDQRMVRIASTLISEFDVDPETAGQMIRKAYNWKFKKRRPDQSASARKRRRQDKRRRRRNKSRLKRERQKYDRKPGNKRRKKKYNQKYRKRRGKKASVMHDALSRHFRLGLDDHDAAHRMAVKLAMLSI